MRESMSERFYLYDHASPTQASLKTVLCSLMPYVYLFATNLVTGFTIICFQYLSILLQAMYVHVTLKARTTVCP